LVVPQETIIALFEKHNVTFKDGEPLRGLSIYESILLTQPLLVQSILPIS
jgi:hypothetical protein